MPIISKNQVALAGEFAVLSQLALSATPLPSPRQAEP
jgi:hypothetical protein